MKRILLLTVCLIATLGLAFAERGHYHFAKYDPSDGIPRDIYLSTYNEPLGSLDNIILEFVKTHANTVAIYHTYHHLNFAAKYYDKYNDEYYYQVTETCFTGHIPNGNYKIYSDFVAANPDLEYYYMVDDDYVWDSPDDRLYSGFSRFSPHLDWVPLDVFLSTTDEESQKCQSACMALVNKFHDVLAVYQDWKLEDSDYSFTKVHAFWYVDGEIYDDELDQEEMTDAWQMNDRLRFYYIKSEKDLVDPDEITPDVDGCHVEATIDGETIDVECVQMWTGGPLFAKWNLGATTPTKFGGYYAWAGSQDMIEDNQFVTTDIQGTEYDTARRIWGDNWQMPTSTQMEELIAMCDMHWLTDYQGTGVAGCLFTGRADCEGRELFLPAAGYRSMGSSSVSFIGELAEYWTSTPDFNENTQALNPYYFVFDPNFYAPNSSFLGIHRCAPRYGMPIRAIVREESGLGLQDIKGETPAAPAKVIRNGRIYLQKSDRFYHLDGTPAAL